MAQAKECSHVVIFSNNISCIQSLEGDGFKLEWGLKQESEYVLKLYKSFSFCKYYHVLKQLTMVAHDIPIIATGNPLFFYSDVVNSLGRLFLDIMYLCSILDNLLLYMVDMLAFS